MNREEVVSRAVKQLEAAVVALPENIELKPLTLAVEPPKALAHIGRLPSEPQNNSAAKLFGFLGRRHMHKAEVAR